MTPRLTPPGPAFVTLARILRPRGRAGEVAAEILTDFPERLTALREVWLTPPTSGAAPRQAAVRRVWLHKDRAIFHFEGVDSIRDAETLRGFLVQIPHAERMELPDGKFYISDLAGCAVWQGSEHLGAVRDVQLDTGTPLLVVETPRGELLIPLAEEICTRIDVTSRRIEVVLPEGLREMNLPG